jgi:hypothetical protein
MLTLCRYVSGLDLEDAISALLKSQYEPDFNDRWWKAGRILLKCLLEVCLLTMNNLIIATTHASLMWAALHHSSLVHCCEAGKCYSFKCFCQLLFKPHAISLLR